MDRAENSSTMEKFIQFAATLGWIGDNCPTIDFYLTKLEEEIEASTDVECPCYQSSLDEDEVSLIPDLKAEDERIKQRKKRRSVCTKRVPSDSSEDSDDDFDLFVSKMKTKKGVKVLSSSDDENESEDSTNSMDDFIVDDHPVTTTVTPMKETWNTPRCATVFSSSDEEEIAREERAIINSNNKGKKKQFQTPRFKTPSGSSRHSRCTPGILEKVTTPKTPSGSAAYKREFKKLRDQSAKELVELFNESVFENKLPDMKIVFNKRMTKTAGFCYYYRNSATNVRTAKVEIAEKVCDSVERLRDTVIHELCHAAAWILNGVKCGHGTYWKYWANRAHKAHPDLPPISRCHQFDIECRFNYKCLNPYCERSYGRHSKSLKKCPDCQGPLQLLEKDGVTPMKQRAPNKFALYVKDEYPSTKADNPGMGHAEIMKLLGQKFNLLST